MNASRHTFHFTLLACLLLGAGHALATPGPGPVADPPEAQPVAVEPAPVREDGLGLVVPDGLAERGIVYHLLPGRAVQATFRSTTPIETFQGETDSVIGYALVAKPDDLSAAFEDSAQPERGALLGAEFALPVDSIRTGIDMRDRHLRTRQWLHEADHPYIRFRLAFFADPRDDTPEAAPEGTRTVRGELVGDMTIRGVTLPLRIPSTSFTLLPESEMTRRVAAGDLMALRCRYTLTLSDFGIDNAIVGRQVAEQIEVDQVLYFSTVPPQDQEWAPDESSPSQPESPESSASPESAVR